MSKQSDTRRTFHEGRSPSDDQKRVAASCPDGKLGRGRSAEGAPMPLMKSPWAQAAPPPEGIGIAFYLGLPVVVLRDVGGGWVEAIYPDNENPGRAHKRKKPYTYTGRGPDAWRGRMWRDQLRFPRLLEAAR